MGDKYGLVTVHVTQASGQRAVDVDHRNGSSNGRVFFGEPFKSLWLLEVPVG
jgi:hypothetical protein